ncbi:peptidylprolyl isomerase [soil metagenome]
MHLYLKIGPLALSVLWLGVAQAQQTPSPAPTPRPSARPTPSPSSVPVPSPVQTDRPAVPGGDQVLVTVNGETITKAEIYDFLGQYSFAPEREAEAFEAAVEALINNELLKQFLDEQSVTVTEPEIDQEVKKVEQQLQQSGSSLAATLSELNISLQELRERLALTLHWQKYFEGQATDEVLREFFRKNEDLFTGTMVKASHILVKVEPDASEAEHEAAQQKLAELKKRIEAGEIRFDEAANKHSEDDGNIESQDGGNLDYFTRRGQYIDEFADAAFELKTGEISDAVRTEYGQHLIQVTDRREGQTVKFEEIRPQVLDLFGFELRQDLLTKIREEAEIDIKPMPEDFFTAPAQLR